MQLPFVCTALRGVPVQRLVNMHEDLQYWLLSAISKHCDFPGKWRLRLPLSVRKQAVQHSTVCDALCNDSIQLLVNLHQVVRQRRAVALAQHHHGGRGWRLRLPVPGGAARLQHALVRVALRRVCLQRLDDVHQVVRQRRAVALAQRDERGQLRRLRLPVPRGAACLQRAPVRRGLCDCGLGLLDDMLAAVYLLLFPQQVHPHRI